MLGQGEFCGGVPVGVEGEEWCCTSLIESIDESFVTTQNSVYKLTGEGSEITLPLSDVERLRAGFSPSVCVEMREMEHQGFHIIPGEDELP